MNAEDRVRFLFDRPEVDEGRGLEASAIDAFGKLLMVYVRDAAIDDCDMILSGRATAPKSQRFYEALAALNREQLQTLYLLVPEIVDKTLAHLLWTVDQVKWLKLVVETQGGTIANLAEVSDGLEGDMYDWKPKFSERRYDKTYYDE